MISDNVFAELLGHHIPIPEQSRPFHKNSTLNEIRDTLIGTQIYNTISKKYMKDHGIINGDDAMKLMAEKMIQGLPLRCIVLFSKGNLSFRVLNVLIALLNKKFIKAVVNIFK